MNEQQWDAETIAEVKASWREAKAVYRTLVGQQEQLYRDLREAEQELRKATRLYERSLQENATVPEHARQLEALISREFDGDEVSVAGTERCSTCKHSKTKHVEVRDRGPAYCMACTGARALHRMEETVK